MESLAKVGKDKDMGLQSNWLQSVMFDWLGHLERHLLEASVETGKDSPWGRDADIEPFLRLLPTSKLALITIVEVMRLYGSGGVSEGVKAARAMLHVGRAIENEYHAEMLKEVHTNKGLQSEIERLSEAGSVGTDGKLQSRSPEQSLDMLWRRELAKREKEGDSSWRPSWTQPIRAKVGSLLVDALIQTARVERTIRHPQTNELMCVSSAFLPLSSSR
jgi:DNA-directed RNA polymerase